MRQRAWLRILLCGWWFTYMAFTDGTATVLGPFETREECERHLAVQASKVFGVATPACTTTPVLLVPTAHFPSPLPGRGGHR